MTGNVVASRQRYERVQRLFGWIITAFGVVCCGIALAHIALGPSAIPGAVPVNATMDSEDRFYATLFLGFGLALVWISRDVTRRSGALLALLITFFASGVARVISAIAVGLPNNLFILLAVVELVLPPLLWWGQLWLKRQQA